MNRSAITDRKPRNQLVSTLKHRRRLIITVVVIALLIYVLAPQTDALWRSLDTLSQASIPLVLLAVFMTLMTYALSAEIYHTLLKHPVSLSSILLVQVATALTSRVAPIGVGTMGLNALFLRKRRHKLSEAIAVVATNNGIGVIGHFILLAIISTTAPWPRSIDLSLSWNVIYWALLIVAVTIITFTLSAKLRHSAQKAFGSLFGALAGYRHQPRRLLAALVISLALSCAYVFALLAVSQALGVTLPFNQIFLIYTFSILTGAATPGGLVGVEAGLIAGFVAYGVGADTALAIALLYRLITYWLPLIPGFIAFRAVQHKYF